jgi:K+-sensing histidine kinase KdpD
MASAHDSQPAVPGAAAAVLAEMFESACAGLAVLRGRDLVFEAVNPAFQALAPGETLVGRSAASLHPELSKRLIPVALRVLESGESDDVRDVLLCDPASPDAPRSRYLTFCFRPLAGHGEELKLWVALMDTTSQVRARQRAELMTSFSTALNSHPELSAVIRRTLRRSIALLGGDTGALWLLDPDGWTLRAEYGTPNQQVRDRTFDLRTLPACQRSFETQSAVFLTRDEVSGAEAELFRQLGLSAGLVAPLVAGPRQLGLLTVAFGETARHADEEELAFATMLAAQSALAIERARALEQVRRTRLAADAAQARFRLLADVSAVLSTALDWESALQATTRLAVGRLADWAILDVVDPGGGLRREAVRCGPPRASAPGWPPATGAPEERDPSLEETLRTEVTRSWDLTRGDEPGSPASPHLASLRAVGAASAMLSPLVVRGQALGVLTLARATGVRQYDRDDVSLAHELAARIALALHNARLLRSVEATVESRDAFIAMARHELRTPLTALGLGVGMLARAAPHDELSKRRIDAIQRATSRVTRAVEQLFDIAHIGDGDLLLDRELFDLVALMRDVVARLSPELELAGCRVHAVAPSRLMAIGDRLRFGGIFTHLLDHAARLGPGQPIDLVLSKRHGRALVEVRYRGAAIAPEVRERIVGPLERNASWSSYANVGLGLWIARWVVEAHGGRLLVHARPDGASLAAEFPIDPSAVSATEG